MKESQKIEWKESWRDEYLKWICGFANAEGGVLVIGRNDKGEAVGVPNAHKLLEDLPNKIRDVLGIMTDGGVSRQQRHDDPRNPVACLGRNLDILATKWQQ
jgi:ATP-dependent DNA helicase RecG